MKFIDKFSVMKSVLLSILLMLFVVQVNAQKYAPASGAGSNGPVFNSGSFQVCILGQTAEYSFTESNYPNLLGTRFSYRIDSGSIFADPLKDGATLTQNIPSTVGSTHYYDVVNSTSLGVSSAGWQGRFGSVGVNRTIQIKWYTPGTYTLYVSRYGASWVDGGAPFSYAAAASHSDRWTAIVITVGAGTPPVMEFAVIAPSAICSGETATISLYADPQVSPPSGYRFHVANDSSKMSLIGFPQDTVIDVQMITGSNALTLDRLVNISDTSEKIEIHITPLGGSPVGTTCDGKNDTLFLFVHPYSVASVRDTIICTGTGVYIAGQVDSVANYTYEFYADAAGTILLTGADLTVTGLMKDTVFYLKGIHIASQCGGALVPINISTEFKSALPTIKQGIDTNACLGDVIVDLASMIDSVVGNQYNFYDGEMTLIADPTQVGPFTQVGDTVFYVQMIETDGCLSDYKAITIHPVPYPVVSVTPINGILHDNTLLLYNKGVQPEFEIERTDEGSVASWTYTLNGEEKTATVNPAPITYPAMTNDTVFHLTKVANEGCVSDVDIEFAMRVMPNVIVTVSSVDCANPDSVATNGASVTICQGDELYLCVLPTDINQGENWGFNYTFTGELPTKAIGTGHNIPYSMYDRINTDTLKPNLYTFTIDTLEISGGQITGYIKNNQIGFQYTVEVVEKLMVNIDPKTELESVCANVDFELPVGITGGKESLTLTYTINEGAFMDTTIYFQNGAADTIINLPIPGQPAKDTCTIRLVSIASNPCSELLDSASYTFVIVPDTLPIPSIFGFEDGLCLNENTTVIYTTEKGMTNYVWSIDASAGYTIGNENESMNDDSLVVTWDMIGGYNISVSYTDENGCTSSPATTDSLTVYPVPTANLVLKENEIELPKINDTLYLCADYDIPFQITNVQGALTDEYGDYMIYAALRVIGENGEDTTFQHHFFGHSPSDLNLLLHLGNVGFGPGNYIVTIDTIVDFLQPMVCPGKGLDTIYLRILEAPTATIIGADPDPICDRYDFDVLIDIEGGQADWDVHYSYTYIYGGTTQSGNAIFESTADDFRFTIPKALDTNSFVLVSLDSIKAPNCPMIRNLQIDTIFELKPLPIPTITIVGMDTDTTCRMATVVYATEEGMENYKWSISGSDANYSAKRNDTSVFEVTWLVAGDYTVSVVYTNENGCRNLESTDSIITVIEIPRAVLTLDDRQEKHNCFDNNNVNLNLTASNVTTANGPWRVVFSAVDYNNNAVKTYTVDNVLASSGLAQLTAVDLPAGKFTFRVDTLIELNSSAKCAGVDNPNTVDTVFIYPEIAIDVLAARPAVVCANEKQFYIEITPNASLYEEVDPAIPHYTGYKFWATINGQEFPISDYSWATNNFHEIYIPESALTPGKHTIVISRAEVAIDNNISIAFCSDINIDSIEVKIENLPVVEIVGQDTACEATLSGATYRYETSIELKEYNWSWEVISGGGSVELAGTSLATDSVIDLMFTTEGHYQIYLAAKDETCENFDTLDVYVTPHPALVDIDNKLANMDYVNCEAQYFEIGSIGNCRLGEDAQVLMTLDSADKILLEYYEPMGGHNDWVRINFTNDTAYFHPAVGSFPITTTTGLDSIAFRITSMSDVRMDPINYSFVFVNGNDVSQVWSTSITGSFILTPATLEAELVEFALNNAIVNCEQQIFPLAITPNCQEGNPVQVRIVLEEATDADDFVIEYDSIGKWVTLDYPFVAMIDSLTGETDTVLFRLVSTNSNVARDVNYTVYLDNEDATIGWDTLKNQMFRLTKNAAAEFVMVQKIDSIICREQKIKMLFEPNCLLSDTNMGQLVIRTNRDISALVEVYHEDTLLRFENYNGEFVAWPGIFNFEDYMDTITLTLKSINPTIIDENVRFWFRIVDTASTLAPGGMVEIIDPYTGSQLPTIDKTWKVKGKPIAPIFTPDTIGVCQTHATWVDFPMSDNLPTNTINVWTNEKGQTVNNASIEVYGIYNYFGQHLDTTTGCYSDETRFVIDVMSDPNVLRMTSFVYCKDQTAETFKFHDYFPENNPNVRYEYIRILDQTWYDTTHYPYNGWDSIPSFTAVNNGVDPIIVSYKLIAHDPSATCSSGRDVAYFTITINPVPAIPTVVSDQVYCNGMQVAKDDSPFPANNAQYTYDWIRRAGGDNIFANMADTGSGSFAFTAINTNTTTEVISDTFTIRPRFTHSHEACGVDTANLVISIMPTPSVNPINQLTVCAGEEVKTIKFDGVATSFNWVKLSGGNDVGLDVFGMSGKDSLPKFDAISGALSAVTATYRITPVIEHNGSSCEGNTMDFTITVLPRAIVNPIDSQVICSNTAITPIAFTGTVGASFQWKNIGESITGLPTGLRTENGIAAYTLINNTDAVQRAIIRVYASNNTCTGDSTDFTIVVYPQPTVKTVNNLTLCANDILATIKFESSPASVSTSFSWRNIGASIIGLPANGTDSIPTDTLRNTSSTPLTAIIEVTPFNNDGLCSGLPMTFNITVNPEPTVTNIPMDYELCNGGRTVGVKFTGSATSYEWEAAARTINTSGFPTGVQTGAFGTYTITNSGVTVDTVTVVVTPKVGICEGTPQTFNIIVHPTPSIANTFTDTTICCGGAYPQVTINSVGTVTWTVTGDQISGLPSNGTVGSNGAFGGWILTNNTNAIRSAIVTLNTSVSGNCAAAPVTFIINVNPAPALTNIPSNATLCSGDTYQQVGFTGNATAYDWAVTNVGNIIGFTATSGSGAFGPFTLTNTTGAAIMATVTVTPKYGSCSGAPQAFNITVNPQPKITSTHSNQVVCSGATSTAANFVGTGTFNWVVTGDNIQGIANRSGSGNFPASTLTNNTNQPQMVTVTATPTSGTCTGTPVSFTITVNPAPTLANKPSNLTLCSGDVYPAISFIGNANAFDWTVTPNGITGFVPTSGSNVFGPFTLTNTGNMTATATVTVTPKYDACAASAETFTITVNPMPTIGRILSDTVICHNKSVSYNFGANAEWIATGDMITGLPASGQGNLNATLENRGTTALTAVIIVTPKSATCIGTPERFTITVNPNPVVDNVPADYTICNNTATTPFTFTGVATEYEWTVSGNANIAGFPTGTQTGHFGTYMLSHTQSTPQTATITVKPKYNNGGTNCDGTGAGLSFKITVNPSAEITNTLNDLPLCDGQSTGTITFAGATDYEWIITGDRISGLPTGVQTGNFGPYTVSNTGNVALNATVTVTPRYIAGGVNCAGTSKSFDIVVNPSTVVTSAGIVANKTNFCVGETMLLSLEATGVNLTYEWYKDGSLVSTSEEYEVAEVGLDASGDYHVIVKGACGNITSEIVTITVGSGDMLLEKWHDIIHVDNYAQLYTGYQWYKDGKKLEGATKQFYHEPGGLKGCYYVVLTLASGGTETSCEKCYDNTKLATKDWKLTVYPNPSKQGTNATGILLSNDDVKYDGSLNVTIHNMNGAEVVRMNKVEGKFDMETIQLAPGVYNVRVVTEEGKAYNEKLIVY